MTAPEMHPMTKCPADEILAAYIDGRLSGKERTEVMEHVASCGDCMDIQLTHLHAVTAGVTEDNVVPARFGWKVVMPAFVTAAAVAMVVFGPLRQSGMDRIVRVAENLPERPFYGRLSADFPHRPGHVPRGENDRTATTHEVAKYELEAVALELEARAEKKPSPENLHAAGAGYMMLGQSHKAVDLLEQASKKSNDPEVLTDLAAAYIANGNAALGLEAANRAWAMEKTPAAAWNRAIALEYLDRKAEAIAAWNEYLELDPKSPWADEARDHLRRLQ